MCLFFAFGCAPKPNGAPTRTQPTIYIKIIFNIIIFWYIYNAETKAERRPNIGTPVIFSTFIILRRCCWYPESQHCIFLPVTWDLNVEQGRVSLFMLFFRFLLSFPKVWVSLYCISQGKSKLEQDKVTIWLLFKLMLPVSFMSYFIILFIEYS